MPKSANLFPSRMLPVAAATLIAVALAGCQTTTPSGKQSLTTMKAMDTNKDNQVSKDEYMKYQEQQFDKIDKNKSKTIDESEWFQHQLEMDSGS